ncbi:unnamed protein product, partial [Pylaiella littoralis]
EGVAGEVGDAGRADRAGAQKFDQDAPRERGRHHPRRPSVGKSKPCWRQRRRQCVPREERCRLPAAAGTRRRLGGDGRAAPAVPGQPEPRASVDAPRLGFGHPRRQQAAPPDSTRGPAGAQQ